jgi:hypothetical protein
MLIFPSPVKRAPVIVVWCAAPIIFHPKAKPFVISKWQVMCAFELVKSNTGAAGIDKYSLFDFEHNLTDNLYKLMTSA